MKRTLSSLISAIFATMLVSFLSACAPTDELQYYGVNGDIVASGNFISETGARENGEGASDRKDDAAELKETAVARDKAIEIALNDASAEQSEVRDLEAELDREKGVIVWEVEFDKGNIEYSYDVDAETGRITDVRKEEENKPSPHSEPKYREPLSESASAASDTVPPKEPTSVNETEKAADPKRITRDKAIEIALNDASAEQSEVRDLEAELDREKGIIVWEVEFEVKNTEYSYDINSESGEILKRETERD